MISSKALTDLNPWSNTRKRSKQSEIKFGKPPGALEFVGIQKVEQPFLEMYRFSEDHVDQSRYKSIQDALPISEEGLSSWMNVTGIHDVSFIKDIGEHFGLHILQQEALLDTEQRPRYEDLKDGLFLITKMVALSDDDSEVLVEQVSFVLTEGILVSFQEAETDVFGPVRERLLKATTRIRQRGTDYLLFALLDAMVDNYLLAIERFGEQVDDLEEELLLSADPIHLEYIHYYKKELKEISKHLRPMREVIMLLTRDEDAFLESTHPFMKDLEDHILKVVETMESYRERLNDHLNLYNAQANAKLNDIIRVLTVFSVVFIPLTFMAGIYGMNFQHMPELSHPLAYGAFWLVEILIAAGMLWYFKRKGWLQ